jgi:hypothetical protein
VERPDFYVVPRYAPMSGVKVSLHGPKPGHPEPFFKVEIDRDAMLKASEAGGMAHFPDGRVTFPGRVMAPDVRHVVRLRWTPGLFRAGRPPAPTPGAIRPGSLGHVLPIPEGPYATDLDLYVCQGRPWWPMEWKARLDNACVGPLANLAGDYLTGVSVRSSLRDKPTPDAARIWSPQSRKDAVRLVGMAVDNQGVLVLLEQWGSIKAVKAAAEQARTALPGADQDQTAS